MAFVAPFYNEAQRFFFSFLLYAFAFSSLMELDLIIHTPRLDYGPPISLFTFSIFILFCPSLFYFFFVPESRPRGIPIWSLIPTHSYLSAKNVLGPESFIWLALQGGQQVL